jgi:CubicO group peptidase (beta-lactamase class C family)
MNEARPDEKISALLATRIDEGDFPSAVYVVAQGGRVAFADALGDAVREPARHKATHDTIYDLASLTKPLVTGLLCAALVERGRVELGAPVARYLTEFDREDKRDITVRQLLTHTSGLPAWRPLYLTTGGRREEVLHTIAAEQLVSVPGARVVYSDLGFITLGLMLQRLAGIALPEFARREIFDPLQLTRTFFNPEAARRTETAACETGNAYEREMCETDAALKEASAASAPSWREQIIWGEVHDGNAHFLGGAAGHAGLFSTARETLRIAAQFLAASTQLLAPQTCALFRENMTAGLDEARSFAWQLAATKDLTAGERLSHDSFGHLGFTGTSCWIDPRREAVFILLTNRTHARRLPFVNINGVRRQFHTLAVEGLERG